MPEKGQRSHEPSPPTVPRVVVSEVYTTLAGGRHRRGDTIRVSPQEAGRNAEDLAVPGSHEAEAAKG